MLNRKNNIVVQKQEYCFVINNSFPDFTKRRHKTNRAIVIRKRVRALYVNSNDIRLFEVNGNSARLEQIIIIKEMSESRQNDIVSLNDQTI